MQDNLFDVVIIGGGMIGAALACSLQQQNFCVAVVEKVAPPTFECTSSSDLRISAIGVSSIVLLQKIRVWSRVMAMRCAPYRKLETWEGQSTKVHFDAAFLGLPELGFMVENAVLQRALWEEMQQCCVSLFCPASLEDLQKKNGMWCIVLGDGRKLGTRLVVGADGANSHVRQIAGIGIHGWSYAQSCLLISVTCEYPSGDTTWQQFTPQGARAFLPLFGKHASLVWYDTPRRVRHLLEMPLMELEKEITSHFPVRLGRFQAHAAESFSLVCRHAIEYVQPGLALVGDAAHTINPLAGQGGNLGYRDIDVLIKVILEARSNGEDWSSERILRRYQRRRRKDNFLMQAGIDLLYFVFSNQTTPFKVLRNIGLMALEHAGVFKCQVLRYALGLY